MSLRLAFPNIVKLSIVKQCFLIVFQNSIFKKNILFSLRQDCSSVSWAYKWSELYWTEHFLQVQNQPSFKTKLQEDVSLLSPLNCHCTDKVLILWHISFAYHSNLLYICAFSSSPDSKLLMRSIHVFAIFVNSIHDIHNRHSINIYWVDYELSSNFLEFKFFSSQEIIYM